MTGPVFFFLERMRRNIFFFSLVPIMFPMCSHEVLHCSQVVPQNVACSTSFWFHMVCPKVKSLVYKVKRWPIGSTFFSILQLAVKRGASTGEYPMSQKTWRWANQYGTFQKIKNKKAWLNKLIWLTICFQVNIIILYISVILFFNPHSWTWKNDIV